MAQKQNFDIVIDTEDHNIIINNTIIDDIDVTKFEKILGKPDRIETDVSLQRYEE